MSSSRASAVEEVTPADLLFLRGDRHARTRSAMVAVFELESAPDWDRLVHVVEAATCSIPRLRQRVVAPPVPIGPARWDVDPGFDLHRHLRRSAAPGDGSRRSLLDEVERRLCEPLDSDRPLWELTLHERYEGERAAVTLKAGHALTDGMGAVQLLGALFDPQPSPPKTTPGVPPTSAGLTPLAVAFDGLRDLPARLAGWLRAAPSLRLPNDPLAGLRATMRSLRPASPPSPLLRARSDRRKVLCAEVATDDLKTSARALGGTVNDLYLAVLSLTFAAYHSRKGVLVPPSLPLAMPINQRPPDAAELGNHWTVVQLALPLDVASPPALVALIGSAVRVARTSAPTAPLAAIAQVAGFLPDALLQATLARAPRPDLQASNIPAPPTDLFLAGAPLQRIIPFAPLPGCAAMATLVSVSGESVIGLHYDPAAITDGTALQQCLEDAIDAALAAGRNHTP